MDSDKSIKSTLDHTGRGEQPIDERLPLIVVETNRGKLVFSSDPLGKEGLRQFMQKLTDEYYLLDSETGPVRLYTTDHVTETLNALANISCCMNDSRRQARFEFADSVFYRNALDSNAWELVDEFTMQPTSVDFRCLVDRTGSAVSCHNNNVWRLVELKTRGFNRSTVLFPSFKHADRFKELIRQIDHGFNEPDRDNPYEIFDLFEKIHNEADRILKTSYDIRGHRDFRRMLTDPDRDCQIGDIGVSFPLRKKLTENNALFFPEILKSHPEVHYVYADMDQERFHFSTRPFPDKAIFTELNGRVVPYDPQREKVAASKSSVSKKRNPKI